MQVINKLLDPKTSEHTAAFVGRLVAVVISRCGASLGDSLDLMLRSVLSKMQQAESLSVMQVMPSFLLYFVVTESHLLLSFWTGFSIRISEAASLYVFCIMIFFNIYHLFIKPLFIQENIFV